MSKTPRWLSRIEMLSTTIIVVMVGSMVIWYEAVERQLRLTLTIGSTVFLYVASLVVFGRQSDPAGVAWWPFALAGMVAGAAGELVNAEFLVTRELLIACLTGVVIGTAHWGALRIWMHLIERGRDQGGAL